MGGGGDDNLTLLPFLNQLNSNSRGWTKVSPKESVLISGNWTLPYQEKKLKIVIILNKDLVREDESRGQKRKKEKNGKYRAKKFERLAFKGENNAVTN